MFRHALAFGVALSLGGGLGEVSVYGQAVSPIAVKSAPAAFTASGSEYLFDTGIVKGTLRLEGKSLGLTPVVDVASGVGIAGKYGLFSHYRMLDSEARYGHGAWDWPSQARLLSDGAVEVNWPADEKHPYCMKVVYRWASANALDVTTHVTAQTTRRRFEQFLACYMVGFDKSLVYIEACSETAGKAGFMEAKEAAGKWQMYPRDDEAVKLIQDGRWKRPPSPVEWAIMPRIAAPLAMRRDAPSGLAAVVMAPARDCFAVATPYGEEGHRSLYLSLLGRDIEAGQTATARARLVIDRGITDEKAIQLYQAYLKEIRD